MKLTKLFIIAAGLVSGCCSYVVTHEGGHRVCDIENEGWKILCLIPIASGDPVRPNRNSSVWFEDTATLETNVMLLDRVMREEKATAVKDIVSYRSEEIVFPLLFKRYTYHTTAELLP